MNDQKINVDHLESKAYLTFKEMKAELATRPKPKFLWCGIKEKTFGLVFGPSKSGKTIFCENLGKCLAIGQDEFFGYELDGKPRKVLFLGLEEYWEERVSRNVMQAKALSDKELKLMDENFLYQDDQFPQNIVRKQDWKKLVEIIKNSNAEVVFIDSITRLNHGKLEDSKTAETIMQRLRSICYELKITLICIHHTPKMEEKPITMDCIKGSSTFAQESDFAIGINKTIKGFRYMKEVLFRYASEEIDLVREFEITNNTEIELIDLVNEDKILNKSDRRRDDSKRKFIVDFINENACKAFRTGQLVEYFSNALRINERQIKSYLKNLSESKLIKNPERGVYISNECEYNGECK